MLIRNEKRPGYKKTKVGWIPDDWKCVPFASVFDLTMVSLAPTPSEKYREIGVRSHGKGVFHKPPVTGESLGDKRVFHCQPGTLVFNIVFAWEQAVAVLSESERGFIASHRFPMYKGHDEQALEDYFLLFFKTRKGKALLSIASPGGAGRNKTLGQKELDSLPVPCPTFSEQKAIAEILTCWDKSIQVLEQKIDIEQNVKKGLSQKLLSGKVRLPEFSKPWKTYRLSNVLNEHGENSTGRETVHSVSVHKGLINQVEHLGRVYSAKDTSNYNLVKPGDLVYTKSPTGEYPFGIVKLNRLSENVVVSPLYGVFTPINEHLGQLVEYHFESPNRSVKYLQPIVHKGAKNTINITNKTFLSGELALPTDAKEQQAIAKVLSVADQDLVKLKRKLALLKNQKSYLLNNLVTGDIRLPQFRRKGDRHE